MRRFLLLLLVFFIAFTTNAQWEKRDIGTEYSLIDIDFVNAQTGFICGSFGVIKKTTDGGETWEDMEIEVNHTFLAIDALDVNNVYIGRNDLFKANDGHHFSQINTEKISSSIHDIKFLNEEIGFLIAAGTLKKTIDGGLTWANVFSASMIRELAFVTDQIGYGHGSATSCGIVPGSPCPSAGSIHKSLDGGDSWEMIYFTETTEVKGLHFLDEHIGFFVGNDKNVYKTQDGGFNWEVIGVIEDLGFPTDALFIDEQIGYVISLEGTIFSTLDGGESWTMDHQVENRSPLAKIYKTEDNVLWVVGNAGVVLRNSLSTVSTETNFIRNAINVFPNPSTEILQIDLGDQALSIGKIELYDLSGQLIVEQTTRGQQQITINTTHLMAGMYLVKMIDVQGHSWSQKIIVE